MKNIFLAVILFITLFATAYGQVFHNLDFRDACDTSKTGICYWDLSWGAKGAVAQDVMNNKKCMVIQSLKENSVGFAEQTSLVPGLKDDKIICITAAIKTAGVEGKGAGLNVGLYDKEGALIANKDMGGFYSLEWIRGTHGWNDYFISLVCPANTFKIKIGAILYGKGKAWFNDYRVVFLSIANRQPSKLAIHYISAVCDTIKKNSLVRDSINIEMLRKKALKIAGQAKTYGDCYLAVNYLLESLRPYGDEHSFFMKPGEVKNYETSGSEISKIAFPPYKLLDDIGYILIPPFHGGNEKTIIAYADTLQNALLKLESNKIKGWVIDLRENTGGNMQPMIMGLGPLFSSEKLGSLVNVNKKADSWHYKNGKYFWDDNLVDSVSEKVILKSKLPIAVLISNQTGSSGEAVTISFIGNSNTRSFGQPTWGLTTGNGSFDLMDGSRIYLASTIMADRNNKEYHGSIKPDVEIKDTKTAGADPVMEAAIGWIKSQ